MTNFAHKIKKIDNSGLSMCDGQQRPENAPLRQSRVRKVKRPSMFNDDFDGGVNNGRIPYK